jgi:hypothetical protein
MSKQLMRFMNSLSFRVLSRLSRQASKNLARRFLLFLLTLGFKSPPSVCNGITAKVSRAWNKLFCQKCPSLDVLVLIVSGKSYRISRLASSVVKSQSS